VKPDRAEELLASAREILLSSTNTFQLTPWRISMAKNVAAKVKSNEVKAAEKKVKAKGIAPYKHESLEVVPTPDTSQDFEVTSEEPASTQPSAFGAFAMDQLGVDRPVPPMVKSKFSPTKPTGDTMEATKTKQELDAEKAQAKMATKAEKERIAAEKKAAAQAEREAKIKARDEAMALRKAEREAAIAKAAEAGADKPERVRTYIGSMLALAERVKSGVYVKGTNGQLRSDDEVARALDPVPPQKVVPLLLEVLKLAENPYAGLNYGQQSMNLRNKLRGAVRKGLKVSEDPEVIVTIDYIKQVRDDGGYATAEAEEAATAS
jgi:hypothetical protein